MRSITHVSREKMGMSMAIVVETNSKKHAFYGFFQNHLDEAYYIIKYLSQNPISYIDLACAVPDPTPEPPPAEKKPTVNFQSSITLSGDWGETESSSNMVSSPPSRFFGNSPSLAPSFSPSDPSPSTSSNFGADSIFGRREVVNVDVSAAREARKLAVEAEEGANNLLVTLAEQAEQIDRIEGSLDRVHFKMDKAERLLRDIESLPAYIGSAIYTKANKRQIHEPRDRKIAVMKGKSPPIDIEILCKMPDDSLVPAILALDEDSISCINPVTNSLIHPTFKYFFADIQSIWIRARPEHADIRFVERINRPRFRFMSSYIQIITNELILRAKDIGTSLDVVFEPGAQKFDYGNARISATPPVSRDSNSTFVRFEGLVKTSSLLSANAPQQVKDDLKQVDDDLDAIFNHLQNINIRTDVIVTETVRQNEQLSKINEKMETAEERLQSANGRLDRRLK
eukprot:TRINITY_DN1245_c0_g1_i2.p1 TRINITY_DN1245_c0_g1~~TRINITY_DN1245_c0_g1_i2.p1  ORF type:complete len:455 (-),score=67.76 TRINITY_DN1245_c0_g1_i2:108-1472(-)